MHRQGGPSRRALLNIPLWIGGQTQNIIDGYGIQRRQADQNRGGDVALAELVIAVDLLGAVQDCRDIPLFKIVVLPKITNTRIHGITPKRFYDTILHFVVLTYTANCGIIEKQKGK